MVTGAGAGAGVSVTIAQHLLQYFAPGYTGFPQVRHGRVPGGDTGMTGGTGFGVTCGGGETTNGISSAAAGAGAGVGVGGGVGTGFFVIEAPHSPQNFISMFITDPHSGHGRVDGGSGAGTTGGTAFNVVPQLPQNFSSGAAIVPHDRQTRSSCGRESSGDGAGVLAGSGTGCDASASDAPQCRQNFAPGALSCPHSGQKTIRISTELLAYRP
jgi:hypothetical protein